MSKMNTIDETALINLVQKYPLLYDLTSPLYNDQQKKDEAWNEISILTSASAYECKTKWSRLRDNYRKALIVRSKNSNGRVRDRAVKYEKQLSFLNENSFTLKRTEKHDFSSEKQDNEPPFKVLAVESSPVVTKNVKVNKVTKVVSSDHQGSNRMRPAHELNAFFENIAETVKTFPKKIQIQMKKEIFKLVNDTEASLVDSENEHLAYYSKVYDSKMNIDASSTTVSNIQETNYIMPEHLGVFKMKEEIEED